MSGILEVTYKDIENTNPEQLTELLRTLLYTEAKKNLIPAFSVHVPLKINVPDGGEDGRIEWSEGPDNTDFIPDRLTLFQCKAGTLSQADCKNELLLKDKTELKPRVKEIFERGGTYVLFYNKNCNTEQEVPREENLRSALVALNKPYASTAKIKIFDANKIAEWTNHELSSVIKVFTWAGKTLPLGMSTWKIWAGYPENQISFIKNEEIEEKIKTLRTFFTHPKKVARLIGLSGLGKSRLVFEAFRPPLKPEEEINQQCISESLVYLDAGELNPSAIISIRLQRKSGILVVDNCDLSLHEKIQREILHADSQLSLLTIDFNPEESYNGCEKFEIAPSTDNTIIKGIISNTYPTLSAIDVEKITEFSQGFPQIAVLIANARIDQDPDIGVLKDDILIKKLIWGNHPENIDELSVLQSSAIFEYYGIFDDLSDQCDYISEKLSGTDKDFFFKTIKKFIARGIVQRRGRYVQIVPRPLAIRLASDWWRETRPDKIKSVICGKKLPQGLIEPMCKQMQNLQFLDEARSIIENMCGPQDPFGQGKILNTNKGSRIFRSMVDVNPDATIAALDRVFGGCSTKQLLSVGPGRRNLIWALEKLCFWRDTFPRAARLMMKFAAAENESWGNNASGQFYQLFHLRLSGTQASFEERLAVLDEGLKSKDEAVQKVCINALSHVLQTHFFSRDCGVESQGSRAPQKEWVPTTWKEVFGYWDSALIRLKKQGLTDDDMGKLARSQIEKSISGMLWNGRLDTLEDVIFSICEVRGYFWPNVVYSLKQFINHNSEKIPQEGKDRIEGWIKKLGPKTVSDRAYVIIIHPEKLATFDGKNFYEESSKAVEDFAKELIKKPEDLQSVLELLLKTPSTHGHLFGYTLGNCIDNKKECLDTIMSLLKSGSNTQKDESVLGGFLFALRQNKSDLVEYCLERIADDPQLNPLLLSLTTRATPERKDLHRLIEQLKKGSINIEDFRILQSGSALSHLSSDVVTEFLDELLSITEESCSVIFEVAYMYTFNDETKMIECIPFFKKTLITKKCFYNILKGTDFNNHLYYELNQISCILLQQDEPDQKTASQIAEELVKLCLTIPNTLQISQDFHQLFTILLSSKYVETTWPIFGGAILSGNYEVTFCLKEFFGGEIVAGAPSFGAWKASILEDVPISIISKWCKENPDIAPRFLAEAILPLIEVDNKKIWSPLARFLLDNFSDDNEVLNGLTNKMHNYAWYGSQIPFYESWLNGFSTLLSHGNLNVRRWAEKNIEYSKRMLQDTKSEEDERDLY